MCARQQAFSFQLINNAHHVQHTPKTDAKLYLLGANTARALASQKNSGSAFIMAAKKFNHSSSSSSNEVITTDTLAPKFKVKPHQDTAEPFVCGPACMVSWKVRLQTRTSSLMSCARSLAVRHNRLRINKTSWGPYTCTEHCTFCHYKEHRYHSQEYRSTSPISVQHKGMKLLTHHPILVQMHKHQSKAVSSRQGWQICLQPVISPSLPSELTPML